MMNNYAIALGCALIAATSALATGQSAPAGTRGGGWITAWGTSQQTLGEATISNGTPEIPAQIAMRRSCSAGCLDISDYDRLGLGQGP